MYLQKGRIRLRTKTRFDSEDYSCDVIVEGKSKGETHCEREAIYRWIREAFYCNAYIREEMEDREGKLVLEQISESSFI